MTEKGTVLVTGSGRGIGRAIALGLARDGYDVVVHCRSRIADAEALPPEPGLKDSIGERSDKSSFRHQNSVITLPELEKIC